MPENLDLKALESKAWRGVFDDGIWDIYLGLLLFLMGVSGWLDTLNLTETNRMAIYISLMIVAMILLWVGKRYITVPRMGLVKFNAERQKRRNLTRLVLFGSVVLGLLVMLLVNAVNSGKVNANLPWTAIFPAIYVLNMVIVFGLGGYFLQFERLYYIGLLYALPVPLDMFLRTSFDIDAGFYLFTFPALVIIAIGTLYLVRFIRAYPVIEQHP